MKLGMRYPDSSRLGSGGAVVADVLEVVDVVPAPRTELVVVPAVGGLATDWHEDASSAPTAVPAAAFKNLTSSGFPFGPKPRATG